jgi:hypothetical protein
MYPNVLLIVSDRTSNGSDFVYRSLVMASRSPSPKRLTGRI